MNFLNISFEIVTILLALIIFHFYRRRTRKNLENKFSEQTKALVKAKEKAENAHTEAILEHKNLISVSQSKTDLLNILAHDLKSPLISIKMLSKMIIEEADKKSPVADYAADIFSTVQRVHNLVDEILDSSIIESGVLLLDCKHVDIGKLAELVVLDNSIAAEQKNQKIILQAEDGCIVDGDESRLRMVIDNLITNGIKYSQLGGGIWVTVRNAKKNIEIEVKDEGLGLSEDDLKKIFKKYQRLSAQPTGGEPSTGLGLSIVRQLVEMHNGTVSVKSELGKGSTFTVLIPQI
jgi:two-component system sensor histidine kinase/response regulator